jgi:hypothetical protein
MILFILAGVLALVILVLLLAASRPSRFRVQRSARIQAAPETIFPLIDSLRDNARWLTYYRKDPAMNAAYSGPASGVGACVDFNGNKNVGTGRVTITRSVPFRAVTMRLEMMKPFTADNVVEFSLAPQGRDTEVTWAMQGDTPFFLKVVHLFFNMDKMVAQDFDTGLATLKSIAEEGVAA